MEASAQPQTGGHPPVAFFPVRLLRTGTSAVYGHALVFNRVRKMTDQVFWARAGLLAK